MKPVYKIIISFLFFINPLILPQDFSDSIYQSSERKIVIPGEQYKSGWLHNFLFGKHWRDLWTTTLEVEVLDLNKFGGGLIPIQKGGGFQTKTLRFKGNDGFIWKFRSIDKDPTKVLPQELQKSLVADIIQDQISSSHPLAPMIVSPLLNAVDVLQAVPKLVFLPDDELLGEFREEFGGLLGFIEIHPDEGDEDEVPGFDEAEKIIGTFKLMQRLEDKRDEKIDAKDFLKARLLDIFLGDWDRHTDQWRWAKYRKNKNEYWRPIPRDRDQAFAKFDGLGPSLAEYYVPQLVHFGYSYPNIKYITWSGRFLDRRYLTELDKTAWDSITVFVQNRLTDSVIEHSIRSMPKIYYDKAGREMLTKLKARRNLLNEISEDYYRLINDVVDIYGTNKDDYLEVNRLSSLQTEVKLFRRDKESGLKTGEPFYQNLFDNCLTKELRIYLLDSDDLTVVIGDVKSGPLLRVIGGNGKDEFIDSSIVRGYFLSFIPIPSAEIKNEFYDSGKKSIFKTGPSSKIDKAEVPEPKDEFEKFEPQQNDRGYEWLLHPLLQYDTDNGLNIGGGVTYSKFNFRVVPFEYQMVIDASYATKPNSYNFYYEGTFNSIIPSLSVEVEALKSKLSLTNYYGFGNETLFDKGLAETDYYRLKQELFEFKPAIRYDFSKNNFLRIGLSYNASEISLNTPALLDNFNNPAYGLSKFKLLGAHTAIIFDHRDNKKNSMKGFYFHLGGSVYAKALDNDETFYKAWFDARGYLTANVFTQTTLAVRLGGGKVWRKYPFFKAEFLGGIENLRGYRRERFSGDESLFVQAEARFYLSDWKIVIPGKLGFLLFAETGRVYTKVNPSKKWHPSYGAGLWTSYLDRQINFSLLAAGSPETISIAFITSMAF
jgi:hypothetical protein